MSKLKQGVIDTVTIEGCKIDVIRGLKNPSCYPCMYEGCTSRCPSEICHKYPGSIYLRVHKESK